MSDPAPIGPHLIYFADPMCSWCYGFSPAIAAIRAHYGSALPIRLILGGLRPGTTEAMDADAKAMIRGHWEHVYAASGQKFDYAFFDRDGFVYDTEPACRAVVALRRHGMAVGLDALRHTHLAFYAANQDITRPAALAEVAASMGYDRAAFLDSWNSDEVKRETWQDFAISQRVGVTGFPTLIAGSGRGNDYDLITNGFQPIDRVLATVAAWRAKV